MKKLLSVFSFLLIMVSCNTVLKTYYGLDRHLVFESRQEIVDFFEKKNNIDPGDLYFFDSHDDYVGVLQGSGQRLSRGYFGVALNDSLMVDDLQLVNTSCVGVSAGVIAASDTISAVTPNPLYKKVLKNIKGGVLSLSRGRPTVVMLVHSNMGSHLESDVKYYKKEAAKAGKDFNYVFIAMDVPLGMPESAR